MTAAAAILPHTDPPQRRLTAAPNVTAHGAGRGFPIKGIGGRGGNLGSAHVGLWVGCWAELASRVLSLAEGLTGGKSRRGSRAEGRDSADREAEIGPLT